MLISSGNHGLCCSCAAAAAAATDQVTSHVGIAMLSVSVPETAPAWSRDLWEQKWQKAHDDNAQMATQLHLQQHAQKQLLLLLKSRCL